MVEEGSESPRKLDALASKLEGAFRQWAGCEPLSSLPRFELASTGAGRVGPGLPRFGVDVRGSTIAIEGTFKDVLPAILLRETIITYFPPACHVDVVIDAINRFCEFFVAEVTPDEGKSFDPARWQALIAAHTRRYAVHFLGTSTIIDLGGVPGGWPGQSAFLHVFMAKLRLHAPLIAPDQVSDIATAIITPIVSTPRGRDHSTQDVDFIARVVDYMAANDAYPTIKRLAGGNSRAFTQKHKNAIKHFEMDPTSISYMHNPGALGLLHCWILLESSPAASIALVRQLTFLPFASYTSAQCIGTPMPTLLAMYTLAPAQLDEFGAYLAELKRQGILLDFQIFRAEKFVETLNWSEILEVPSPEPVLSVVSRDLRPVPPVSPKTHLAWQLSWVAQQVIPLMGLRKLMPRAVTHLDAARNLAVLSSIIADAGILASSRLLENMKKVFPLLERHGNVEYVLRVLDQAIALLRHLFDHPGSETQGPAAFDKLGLIWQTFREREWLLNLYRVNENDINGQADILGELGIAAHFLSFFAPYSVPQDAVAGAYLHKLQKELVARVKGDITRVPPDAPGRARYFAGLLDQVVSERWVVPRISFSVLFRPNQEDFYLFSRTSEAWAGVSANFTRVIGPHVAASLFQLFRDQSGAQVIGGVFRATRDQFETIRQLLVGPKGVLGPGASILIGRRVPYWDFTRRNFLETFDMVEQQFAPIGEYLAKVQAEQLATWAPPRVPLPPYARQVLAVSFAGSIERAPGASKGVKRLGLTPSLTRGLKDSCLLGKPALHNLVEHDLKGQWSCDLNWPTYGLERYFLHVFLSTARPKYIYTHLVTPATRRVLASTAVSGFQTVLIEYLWPKGAPDDHFLQYLYTRTEKNVLAYSVHRVLSDTRFFNLDKLEWPAAGDSWDSIDLQVLAQARPRDPARFHVSEFPYGGDTRHAPGSAGWELAAGYFARGPGLEHLPPDSRSTFEFDPRFIGFTEKTALVARGNFDATPLCQALPFGHYFRTEEVAYEGAKPLAGQPGHVILFDFPAVRVAEVNSFLDGLLRNPAVAALSVNSYLAEQSLLKIQGMNLARVNPLRCNPYAKTGTYYHLPKRILREGGWQTLSLKEQLALLADAWAEKTAASEGD